MITLIKKELVQQDKFVGEFRGLSTDTKPTENIANGSIFIEIDTGKIFFYDQDNQEWKGE